MARFAKLFALVSAIATAAFTGPALATEARYTCSDGSKLTAQFSPPDTAKGSVALTFATGRELKLPQVLSADGGRYADADIEFWIKGRSATLTMKGVKETCSTQSRREAIFRPRCHPTACLMSREGQAATSRSRRSHGLQSTALARQAPGR
jgi:membrane-bound inhibitor of C-type lysozyme